MKLKKLQLENWCQHSNLTVLFPDDALVRLGGANNCGKTNLIRAIGRVLAQGRSDFGDINDIQYGQDHARITLDALTSERISFTLNRTIKEKPEVSLIIDGQDPILRSESIQQQLTEWFGRQDTLLSLFIAQQGEIASLLKAKGRDRLVQFIEICGFKGFLKRQEALNKFIKTYPAILDPSPVLLELNARLQLAQNTIAARTAEVTKLEKLSVLRLRISKLRAEKLVLEQQTADLALKRKELGNTVTDETPLPDLAAIQANIAVQELELKRLQGCVTQQAANKSHQEIATLKNQLNLLVLDNTDYSKAIQEISSSMQADVAQKAAIEKKEGSLTSAKEKLDALASTVATSDALLSTLPYSTAWVERTIVELKQLMILLSKKETLTANLNRLKEELISLASVPPPTAVELALLNATENSKQELLELKKHAQKGLSTDHNGCPLCKQPWLKAAIAARIKELEQGIASLETAQAQSAHARTVYDTWLNAQSKQSQVREQMQAETVSLASVTSDVQKLLSTWKLKESEVAYIHDIHAGYASVRSALNAPRDQLIKDRLSVQVLEQELKGLAAIKPHLEARISGATRQVSELLAKQAAAQMLINEQVRLKQQIRTAEAQNTLLYANFKNIPDFNQALDYKKAVTEAEAELTQLRNELRIGGERYTQAQKVTQLQSEVRNLLQKISENPWTEARELQLSQLEQQVNSQQQLEAELRIQEEQVTNITAEITTAQAQQALFKIQSRNLSDMQAVSSFLSYDNGPQKFLQVFFQDTLNQTNLFLSEMGLPVSLHMGENLEIMVTDAKKRVSSSLALGGGYSNLIGIAFRIALQKMILPRVNTVILDEPSTHIDEGNMELLVPFFEHLKDNLHTYGIEQCLLIDHHPAWKNSSVPVIQIGAET